MLDLLATISKYGFFDIASILLGLGLAGWIGNKLRIFFKSRYVFMHIAPKVGPKLKVEDIEIANSLLFEIRNSGLDEINVKNAAFMPSYSSWKGLWVFPFRSKLEIAPNLDRISHDKYELKFIGEPKSFDKYRVQIQPGFKNGVKTVLPLSKPVTEDLIRNRQCGTMEISFSTTQPPKDYVSRIRV